MAASAPAPRSRFDPAQQKPDSGYITNFIRTAIYEFGDRTSRDAARDAAYWQTNDVPHPTHVDFQEVHAGVAPEMVQRIKGIFSDRPTVQIGTTTLSDMKARQVEKEQNFANALFPALEDQSDADTWDAVMEDVLRFGRGYDALEYVPGRWSAANGYPTLGKGEASDDYAKRRKQFALAAGNPGDGRAAPLLPMSWRSLPARGVFTHKDEGGIYEAMSIEQRRAGDVAYRYDLPKLMGQIEYQAANPNARQEVSNVIFVRYWNRKFAAHWVSRGWNARTWNDRIMTGETLLSMAGEYPGELPDAAIYEHDYGRVPIIETSGITSTSLNPAKAQLSVLDHLIPLATYLDQLVSQKATAVRMWAFPTPYLKNMGINGQLAGSPALGEDMRPIPIEIEPGKLLMLLPGEDIGWLVVPQNSAGADQLMEFVERHADALGISSAVFDASALSSNGYLYNSVLNAIRSKYNPIITHVRRSHRKRVQHALDIVSMHGEPLYVWKPGDGESLVGEWFSLAPEDIKGNTYQITTKFQDHLPVDDASDAGIATQLTDPAHPLISDKTARTKHLRVEDAQAEAAQIKVEQFENSQAFTQFLQAKGMEKAGAIIDQQERGSPQGAVDSLSAQQVASAPPAFIQALTAQGAQMPAQQAPGSTGGSFVASPSTAGGVPGAPAAPVLPGVNRSMTPPPPARGMKPGPKAKGKGGRAAGQSRAPGNMKAPATL